MIFVVVEEVIPETQQDKYTDIATLGFIGGFICNDFGCGFGLVAPTVLTTTRSCFLFG